MWPPTVRPTLRSSRLRAEGAQVRPDGEAGTFLADPLGLFSAVVAAVGLFVLPETGPLRTDVQGVVDVAKPLPPAEDGVWMATVREKDSPFPAVPSWVRCAARRPAF